MQTSDGTRWRRVFLLIAGGVAAALHIGKVPPAMALLRADLGIDLVTVGWVLSLVATIGAIGGAVIGAGADRIGHRRGVLLGLFLLTAGSLFGGAAPGVAALLVSRAVEGAGSILVAVSVPALIWRSVAAGDARLAFGLWGAWMPLGVSIMMAVSPAILAGFGWPAVWRAASALSALVWVALAIETRGMAAPRAHGALPARDAVPVLASLRMVGAVPAVWLLAGCFLLYSFCFMTVLGFLPVFFLEERGIDPAAGSLLVAVVVLCNALGNVGAGWLATRGMPRWALLSIAFVAMGGCAAGIFSGGLPMAASYGLCLLYSTLGGLLPATVMNAAAQAAPRPQLVSSASGLVMQGSYLGQLAGAPVVGLLASWLGWWAVALCVGAVCLSGLGLALGLRVRDRRPAHA